MNRAIDLSRPGREPALSSPGPRPQDQAIGDWVFEVVKDEIVYGVLPSEHVLVEGVLAERFGVSRGPAREALQRLGRAGLVRPMPRVGYIVSSVSLRDYDEVFTMRLGLEPIATELATKRIAAGVVSPVRLGHLADESKKLVDGSYQDGSAVARMNHAFHLEIARLSGNQRMERVLDSLLTDVHRVLAALAYSPEILDVTWDDHPNLVRTMLEGDPAAARDLMHTQLSTVHVLMRGLTLGTDLTLSAPQ